MFLATSTDNTLLKDVLWSYKKQDPLDSSRFPWRYTTSSITHYIIKIVTSITVVTTASWRGLTTKAMVTNMERKCFRNGDRIQESDEKQVKLLWMRLYSSQQWLKGARATGQTVSNMKSMRSSSPRASCVVTICTNHPYSLVLHNGLALTPPMGFLSWQRYHCTTDCAKYIDILPNTLELGKMPISGQYQYVIIDERWLDIQ